MNIAVGDLGAPAAKKYDIEGWLPGQRRYRELTSCSNTTDYQARRLQTRVRRADGSLETLHTLNGTATAIGRTLIAILENHQRADGSVEIPEHLWQYLPERVRVLQPTGSSTWGRPDRRARAASAARDASHPRGHVDRDARATRSVSGTRVGCATAVRVEPSDRAVAMDHAVRVVPDAGLVRLGVVASRSERDVVGVHEPAEMLGLGQQLLGACSRGARTHARRHIGVARDARRGIVTSVHDRRPAR